MRCFHPLMVRLTFQEKQYIYAGRPENSFNLKNSSKIIRYNFFAFLGLFVSVHFLAVSKDLILEIKSLMNKNQLSGLHKVHIFWEGHNFLPNLHHRFVLCSNSQIYSRDFANFCGLLRIYELYKPRKMTCHFLEDI